MEQIDKKYKRLLIKSILEIFLLTLFSVGIFGLLPGLFFPGLSPVINHIIITLFIMVFACLTAGLGTKNRLRIQKELETAKWQVDLSNQSKNEFLANMSHEIQTPMSVMIGFADLLIKERISANH